LPGSIGSTYASERRILHAIATIVPVLTFAALDKAICIAWLFGGVCRGVFGNGEERKGLEKSGIIHGEAFVATCEVRLFDRRDRFGS